jgi:N-acetyl sugar amidotransferase
MHNSLVRCTKCLMPTTRPDTAFINGVCSGCISHERRVEVDWTRRRGDLLRILESAKVNSNGYHCIVPSSGGKDSHYQVLKLIELGARPLVVTATTCMLTEIGKANIRNLARYATTIEVTPNLRVRALLNRLGLELAGDASWPEHVAINAIPFRIASEMGIPLIFYGESPLACYGSPHDATDEMTMTKRWIMEFGGQLGLRPADLVGQHGLRREDMADYTMPSDAQMEKLSAYFLGQFIPWNSHRNGKEAVAAGMQTLGHPPSVANWWTPENLDNAQTGAFHDYFGALKFGYGRLCAQISIDIRYGMISRDEAIEIVRAQDCAFPEYYMDVHYSEILRHIEMTEDRFWELAREYANKEMWDISGREPKLKPDVWEQSFC